MQRSDVTSKQLFPVCLILSLVSYNCDTYLDEDNSDDEETDTDDIAH